MTNAFVWPIRVYYEDTDVGGVVYHTNYLKYMERARTELLRSIGFEQDRLINEEDVIFAVRSLTMEYLKPARFNDQLAVITQVIKTGKASLHFKQEIQRSDNSQRLCEAEVRVACLTASTLQPRPIPETIMREIHHAS